LGGSTVFDGNPSIPVIIQDEFIKNGFNQVKVFNYGVVSSVSSMELARIIFEVLDCKPDLIIMYNGANDMMAPFYWDPRPGYPYNFLVYENNPLAKRDVQKLAFTLFSYSYTAKLIGWNFFTNKLLGFERVRKEASYNTDEWRDRIAEIYVNNIIKADKTAKAFGSDFIAFLQPMVYFKDTLSSSESGLLDKSAIKHNISMRAKILSRIAEGKALVGLKFEDLSDIFDHRQEAVFTDFVHVTPQGRSIVAKAIFEYIVKNSEIFKIVRSR
jgi:lysophospholipase L1-like esterase